MMPQPSSVTGIALTLPSILQAREASESALQTSVSSKSAIQSDQFPQPIGPLIWKISGDSSVETSLRKVLSYCPFAAVSTFNSRPRSALTAAWRFPQDSASSGLKLRILMLLSSPFLHPTIDALNNATKANAPNFFILQSSLYEKIFFDVRLEFVKNFLTHQSYWFQGRIIDTPFLNRLHVRPLNFLCQEVGILFFVIFCLLFQPKNSIFSFIYRLF